MNCKPGDLAVVVRSKVGNLGRIVRCIRLLDPSETPIFSADGSPLWETDVRLNCKPLRSDRIQQLAAAPDSILRPLRNDPGEDETLQWAGLPHQTKEPA